MKISVYNKLKKLMMMTLSEVDNECLQAIRGANRILREEGIDWNRVFSRTVTVVNEFEAAPEDESPDASKIRERERIDEAFSVVEASDPRGSFADFISSLKEQWERRGSLSIAQKDSLFKAAQRVQDGR